MRVYEAKMVYSLVSLGDEIHLNAPAAIADYLRSAFEENPMQEAFYCVYLDRKNHPLGRHLTDLPLFRGINFHCYERKKADNVLSLTCRYSACPLLAGAPASAGVHQAQSQRAGRQNLRFGVAGGGRA